jgi:REP element-mobilizing transposase RayT
MSVDKFQNKYRIPSARAQWWNYSANGCYFITICTAHREHLFGEIENGEMHLSDIGKIAHDYWYLIPEHFQFVNLDAFVVMPNHVHGIVVINKQNDDRTIVVETPKLGVSTGDRCEPLQNNDKSKRGGKNEKWNPGTLGVIINQYKRICSIHARKIHVDFAWQTRFHDHIIRDNNEYQRIADYIDSNPDRWQDDIFYC